MNGISLSGSRRLAGHWSVFCVGLLVVASCSFGADQRAATQAISQFHDLYNAENYSAIYAGADNAFRQAMSEKDLDIFLAAVHRKLGQYQSSVSAGWRMSETFSGIQAALAFRSEFVEGEATEQFLYKVSSGKAYLIRYDINSRLLVTK